MQEKEMDIQITFFIGFYLAASVIGQNEMEIHAHDPYKAECTRRKIQCHQRAICRLDIVTETFYCQCIPGHNGDGVHFCQEPSAKIIVHQEQSCDGAASQLCVIKCSLGETVRFMVSVVGDHKHYNIQWFKFYSSYGHTFYSYRKRLRNSATVPSKNIQIMKDGFILKLEEIQEDDYFPNLFWVQLDTRNYLEMTEELEPYEISSYDILNPSQTRYYFVLDSQPIDMGTYLTGDTTVIYLTLYKNISSTAFVSWVKEPENLTLLHSSSAALMNSTSVLELHDLLDKDFGKIRAVIYDYLEGIPGKVMVAQKLFVLRKDISKVCIGQRSVRHCKCSSGFKGNGLHCVDVDECREGMPLQCLSHASCVNTFGSYLCKCPAGYEGDGVYACLDVDECFRGLSQCNGNATCVNTLGSYACTCPRGYFSRSGECIAKSMWTPWSPWSICSVTCGSQNQMRFRICTHPESGMSCEGPTADLKPCDHLQECPVNGQWSEWSPWSPCSSLCSGIKKRIRNCDNPPPSAGGEPCRGTTEETSACRSEQCSIDGSWSQWSLWSQCPLTCGLAVVSRTRSCSNPTPQNDGKVCPGHNYEEAACGLPKVYCEYVMKPEKRKT
ncbi:uncharacterized protein LOC120531013 isoform X2 [Polypterus senegalus]|uniref:uncharacterized protein LOC120531013 isoform X2 n=1 Tax=Polypterus senegalus TaxID=55291 RepID=UPI0019631EE6|nr:uncharacterized protein LOC120531013 isoform X2 [Polypterus senegalus]XP_039611867.1 uncharacterized protein LOC120531013 isoform X2 [Polypterus senegalus]XP_039611868.1 uncharacterized protein LOC120531013 isoform X2 [Polypterus senegalus]XP_039611869.1 uncharacterized protein LOC120531013 isoform X2 [Polypterus senegalus]